MKLHEYITSKKDLPFEYGTNDCVLFSIGWINIASGKNYLEGMSWSNEQEAAAEIEKQGGLIKAFDARFTRIEPGYAKDGDLTVCDGVASLFSGVYIVSVSKQGLIYKSRTDATNAWTL